MSGELSQDATRRRNPTRAPARSATPSVSNQGTIADLLASLGRVSPARVRLRPFPGTATERDVIAVHDRENRLCELVDGTQVEKVMGFDLSRFAVVLAAYLVTYFSATTSVPAFAWSGTLIPRSGQCPFTMPRTNPSYWARMRP